MATASRSAAGIGHIWRQRGRWCASWAHGLHCFHSASRQSPTHNEALCSSVAATEQRTFWRIVWECSITATRCQGNFSQSERGYWVFSAQFHKWWVLGLLWRSSRGHAESDCGCPRDKELRKLCWLCQHLPGLCYPPATERDGLSSLLKWVLYHCETWILSPSSALKISTIKCTLVSGLI